MSKLQRLAESEGFDNPMDLAEEVVHESVVPGICAMRNCDYTTRVEPDCDAGYCEECGTRSVQSLLVLMGII